MTMNGDPGRIKVQMKVQGLDGRTGTTCPDCMSCCAPDETPVVWDGEDSFEGTPTSTLTILGPENARPDPSRCGTGRGKDCCIFLTVGAEGFECQRFSSLRFGLMFRKSTMSAQRQPTPPYPGCFLPEVKG